MKVSEIIINHTQKFEIEILYHNHDRYIILSRTARFNSPQQDDQWKIRPQYLHFHMFQLKSQISLNLDPVSICVQEKGPCCFLLGESVKSN